MRANRQTRSLLGACLIGVLLTSLGCGPESHEPERHTSYTQVGEVEDVSYAGVTRMSSRIVVPSDRTREELRATLERAARELADETQPDAVMVSAYRPQDEPTGSYTAGRAVYAPNGRWGDADSSKPMKMSVDLSELYFTPPRAPTPVAEQVHLMATFGDTVPLSVEFDSWGDKDIIARVPNGTEATIEDRRTQPLSGGHELVRYRVRATHNDEEIQGWVNQDTVARK